MNEPHDPSQDFTNTEDSTAPASMPYNPYLPPESMVHDQAEEQIELESLTLASRGSRFVARFIDNLVTGVPITLLTMGISDDPNEPVTVTTFMVVLLVLVLLVIALQLFLLVRDSQSIGKKLMRTKIVRTDGSRAGGARLIFMRELSFQLVGAIPTFGPFINLISVCLIFGEQKRCGHDYVAGTKVVTVPGLGMKSQS